MKRVQLKGYSASRSMLGVANLVVLLMPLKCVMKKTFHLDSTGIKLGRSHVADLTIMLLVFTKLIVATCAVLQDSNAAC